MLAAQNVAGTRRRLAVSTGALTAVTLASLALGYGREVLIAHYFGASRETDAFFIAYFTPQIFYQLLISGPLVWGLTPLLTRTAADEGEASGDRLAGSVLTIVSFWLTIFAILAIALAPEVIAGIAPFFHGSTEGLTVDLFRIMTPQIVTYGAGAVLSAVLLARGRVLLPVVAQIVNNAIVLALIPVLRARWGIDGAAAALLLASVGFIATLVISTSMTGRSVWPRTARLGSHRRPLALALVPPLAVGVLSQIPGFWERAFATALPAGDLTSLSYGYRLLQVAQTGMGALTTVALVGLSVSAAQQRKKLFATQVDWTVRLSLQFSLLAMGATIALAPWLVSIFYSGGALSTPSEDVVVAATTLAAIGLPFSAIIGALQQPLYVTYRWKGLVYGALVYLAIHLPLAPLLILTYGYRGFVAANLTALAGSCGFYALYARSRYGVRRRPVLSVAVRSGLATAVAGTSVVLLRIELWRRDLGRPQTILAVVIASLGFMAIALLVLVATRDLAATLALKEVVRRWRTVTHSMSRAGRKGAGIVMAAALPVGLLGLGALLAVRAQDVLMLTVVLAVVTVGYFMLSDLKLAVITLVIYLPLDWVIVLFLDSHGFAAGRLLRSLLIIGVVVAWAVGAGKTPMPRVLLPTPVILVVSAIVLLSFIELLNPHLPSVNIGVLGILTRLVPLAMLVVGADLIRRRGALTAVAKAMALVMIAVGVVVLLQQLRGDTLIGILGGSFNYPVPFVGTNTIAVARYPGPFLGAQLPQVMLIAFALFVATYHLMRGWWRITVLLASVAWFIALFANNQRSLFLFLVFDAPIVFLLGRYGRRLLALPLVLLLAIPAVSVAGGAFVARVETITASPQQVIVNEHLRQPFEKEVVFALNEAPLGRGLGVASPGARFLGSSASESHAAADAQTTPESFVAAIALELGLPGVLLYLTLFVLLAGLLLNHALRSVSLAARRLNAAMLAILIWVVQLAVTYEPLSYFPFAPLFWLLVGSALGMTVLSQAPRGVYSRIRATAVVLGP